MNQPLHRFKAELFKALGSPARIRILELLRFGEKTVGEIQAFLGTEGPSVSQQLAVLRAKDVVVGRREGTNVYYSVRDPQVFRLLDVARGIFENHLISLQAMAEEQLREDDAMAAAQQEDSAGGARTPQAANAPRREQSPA
ncbi:MAG: winged helix-turn-helix transcriptional regulator [Chloroflexi bacterium]|nr:winged helix-turn-helix transcriptional regulator [Chloroflexota bacterium]